MHQLCFKPDLWHIEYIVIDAASNDGTIDKIKNHESKIDYFLSEPDTGIYAGINKGISLASGDYIIILNSDDYYVEDAIEKLVEAILIDNNEIVAANSYNINEDNQIVSGGLCRSTWTSFSYLVCPLKHETMMVHRDTYNKIGCYREDMSICSDWFWMSQAYSNNCTVSLINENILYFRTIGKSKKKDLEELHAAERLKGYSLLFPEVHKDDIHQLKYISQLSCGQKRKKLKRKYLGCKTLHEALDSIHIWPYASGVTEYPAINIIREKNSGNCYKNVKTQGGLRLQNKQKTSTNEKPLVSVVTTVFNDINHVERAIQSVLNQTYNNIEYIVIDAYSTDGTLELIAEYKNKIDYYISESDKGIYSGMNKGISLSNGDFIIILNSDDYYKHDAIEKLINHAVRNKSKIVGAHAVFIDEKDQYLRIEYSTVDDRIYFRCTLRHETLLVHKSVYSDIGLYDETLEICSDWMWIINAYDQYKIDIVDEPLLYFLAQGVSSKTSKLHDTEKINYFKKSINGFDENDIDKLRYPHHLPSKDIAYYSNKYKDSKLFLDSMKVFYGIMEGSISAESSHKDTSKLPSPLQHKPISKPILNIAFVVWGLLYSKGGLERLGANLANEFQRRGHKVTVLCHNDGNTPQYSLHDDINLIKYQFTSNFDNICNLRNIIIKNNPDVFVAMFSWKDLLRFPLILKDTGIPFVLSEHNDPHFIENVRWSKNERIACMDAADSIHLLCRRFSQSIPQNLREKITVIPNPIYPVKNNSQIDTVIGKRKTIISVGHLVKHKQHELLIDAFAEIAELYQDWDLKIWGEGNEKASLNKRINEYNLEHRIQLCGRTDNIEIEYANAQFMCHPAKFEGFGLVVAEAMSHGLPVVGFSGCSGVNEIIIDNVNGILTQKMEVPQLAECLAKLMKSDDYRQLLGHNAIKTVKRYEPTLIYNQWEQLLLKTSKYKGNTNLDKLECDHPICQIYKHAQGGNLFKHNVFVNQKITNSSQSNVTANNQNHAKSTLASVIGYDDDWQYPVITEKHAYYKAKELLCTNNTSGIVYFGFPWATLIDKTLHAKEKSDSITRALYSFKSILSKYNKIITVCQHIRMLKLQNFFKELGITDVFWSHAVNNQPCFPESTDIKIHPFPLYPVQAIGLTNKPSFEERNYLFSFVGTKPTNFYLSQSRSIILDKLQEDKRGFVKSRSKWHFEKIVYDYQIRSKVDSYSNELLNEPEEEEFKMILNNTKFALCPSGSGPNSIRLWESIGFGCIPVLLADTHLLPGDYNLWKQSIVFCSENEQDILKLPERLEVIENNQYLVNSMLLNLNKLWNKYKPEVFITDIVRLFNHYNHFRNIDFTNLNKPYYSNKFVLNLSTHIISNQNLDNSTITIFALACTSRLLNDKNFTLHMIDTHINFKKAISKTMDYKENQAARRLKSLIAG